MNASTQYWRSLGYNVTDQGVVTMLEQPFGQPNKAGRNWQAFHPARIQAADLQFAGVYAFLRGRAVLYVGSSVNLSHRLYHHPVLQYLNSNKSTKPLMVHVRKNKGRNEHLTLEMNLIQRLHPKYNRKLK